jgi:hypothetical protein
MIKTNLWWITKQFMCEWKVEWTHCVCKTLKNKLKQNLMHSKMIFECVIEIKVIKYNII